MVLIKHNKPGYVTYLCDGIATVSGIDDLRAGEIVFFLKNKVVNADDSLLIRGLVLNLNLNNAYVIILGNEVFVNEQTLVFRSNKLFNINTSLQMFGGVFDALGQNKESSLNINYETIECSGYVEKKALGIVDRVPVNVPLRTGLKSVDSLVPIGRGQRELIIGDRQTGKTSVAVDAILNHADVNNTFITLSKELKLSELRNIVWFVYCAIGQKQSTVAQVYSTLKKYSSSWFTSIIGATASEPAPLQFLAPYSSCTLGEFIRDIVGGHCTIIYDDLSKHAVAYRQMSLLLRRPPGREAFPGDVFYVHSRLLERAGALRNITYFNSVVINNNSWSFGNSFPRGTLTAFPVIETQAGDVSAYIPTNVISITDGQIFLETELFHKGIRPAINVGLSVSRVGSAAQPALTKKVTGSLKIDLAQFREIEGFAKLGASLDDYTQRLLTKGENLIEILKQKLNSPLSTIEQALSIFLGVGYSTSWLNSILKIKTFNRNSFFTDSRLRVSWFELFRLSTQNFSLSDLNMFLVSFLNFIKQIGLKDAFNFNSTEIITVNFSNKFPLFFFDDILISFLMENSVFINQDNKTLLTNLKFFDNSKNFKFVNLNNNMVINNKNLMSTFLSLSQTQICSLCNKVNISFDKNNLLFSVVNLYINLFSLYFVNLGKDSSVINIKSSFVKLASFSNLIFKPFIKNVSTLNNNIILDFKKLQYLDYFNNNINIVTFLNKNIFTEIVSSVTFTELCNNTSLNKKVRNKLLEFKKFYFSKINSFNNNKLKFIYALINISKFDSFNFDVSMFELSRFNLYLNFLKKFTNVNLINFSLFTSLTNTSLLELLISIKNIIKSKLLTAVYLNNTLNFPLLLIFTSLLEIKRFKVFMSKLSNFILIILDSLSFYCSNIFFVDLELNRSIESVFTDNYYSFSIINNKSKVYNYFNNGFFNSNIINLKYNF